MNTVAEKSGPHYHDAVELLIQLHLLMRIGKSETEEADEIRDALDIPWKYLSETESRRIRNLSADLASIEPDSPFRHPASGGVQRREVAQEIRAARQSGDYETILAILRDRPECVSADRAAFLRGWCYERLGEPEVAALFFEHAAQLDQSNDLYAVFVSADSAIPAADVSPVS
jgi:hypothetical protein